MKEVLNRLLGATDYMTSLAYQYQMAFVLCVALGVLLIMGLLHVSYMARRRFRLRRGKRMTREERIQYRKLLVADALTEKLEQLEFEGKLSRLEVQQEYRKLAHYLSNGELRPKVMHPQAIRQSILKKAYTAIKKEIVIPGPKPGEELTLVPFPDYKGSHQKQGRLGAGYLARKTAAA